MPEVKVFGIGLNKTGTTTLARALRALGYSTVHGGTAQAGETDVYAAVERAVREGSHPFAHVPELDDVDAFFDVRAVERFYPQLDEAYPGSRFILHTRALEPWLASRQQHVEHNVASKARGAYSGDWLTVDLDAWTRMWTEHHQRVRTYFGDRPDDLLEIDVTNGQGWEVLTPFLGCAQPAEPFPWANKGRGEKVSIRLRRAASQRLRHGLRDS